MSNHGGVRSRYVVLGLDVSHYSWKRLCRVRAVLSALLTIGPTPHSNLQFVKVWCPDMNFLQVIFLDFHWEFVLPSRYTLNELSRLSGPDMHWWSCVLITKAFQMYLKALTLLVLSDFILTLFWMFLILYIITL